MTLSIEEREALIERAKNLPEIEFIELLRGMATVIRDNKWEHIIDDCFDIENYEEELDEANNEIKRLEHDLDIAKITLNKIRDLV